MLVSIALVTLGAFAWWNGRKTWRGEDFGWAATNPAAGVAIGTRRRYRSWMGAGHVGLVGGPAFVLLGVGNLVRILAGEDSQWWLWWVVSLVAVALIFAGALYSIAYLWFGVPDGWRPPCQRGWEVRGADLVLERPRAFHEWEKREPDGW